MLARIVARVQRLLTRRGLAPGDADMGRADPAVEECPVLAGITSASIQGARCARASRGGAGVARGGRSRRALGAVNGAAACAPCGLRSARQHRRAGGRSGALGTALSLSAPAGSGAGPAAALDDGHVVLTLKTAWVDGTRQLVFEPLEPLEKLAALVPRPRINLVLYHGVLAPHSG